MKTRVSPKYFVTDCRTLESCNHQETKMFLPIDELLVSILEFLKSNGSSSCVNPFKNDDKQNTCELSCQRRWSFWRDHHEWMNK